MKFAVIQLVIQAFLCFTFLKAVDSEQCEKLNATLWKPCVDVGFTHTIAIPSNVSKHKLSVRFHKERSLHNSSQCSGSVIDMMLCSFYVPQCQINKEYPLVLPCKRVCAEFLYKCKAIPQANQMNQMDFLTGPCNLLPNAPPSAKMCMEPKNFEPSPEARDILDRKCHEVIIPICKKNYTHTLLSPVVQKEIYTVFYDKNYTADSAKDDSAKDDYEDVPILSWQNLNNTKCKANFALALCSELLPPCFPSSKGGRSYYTICRETCKSLWDDCPDDYHTIPGELFCEHLVDGDHPTGFCKNDRWPSEWKFEGLEMHLDMEKTPVTKSSHSYGWVAAAVLVPVAIVLLIVGAVYFWKRYRLKKVKGFEPKELINEEAEEKGEL